ncbi:MAG: MFS transporter [Hyphomicrobiaceae bacterium]|nr:MFS transporter [Hyphomicrobiaceae bacterium]MCC0023798.1 MFS transporter [Hyphomicrobiaceae bacterium]
MSAISKIFGLDDFRRLFAGTTTSQLGDQFALIATPWLVLQLTGDPLAVGLVLALEGAPRALFMLVGGAVTDRFSPRMTMLISDLLRCGLALLLAVAILTGQIEMWVVYFFSLGIGLVAGFAVPAGNAIVPMIIDDADLQAGNAAVMGGGQIMGFVGPVVAGLLIGSFSNSLAGVGIAFLVDALTFAFSALMLWRMHNIARINAASDNEGANLLASIFEGLKFVWQSPAMRMTFFIIAAINLFFVGPMMVGIPILADKRLSEGASAFGLIMSAFAGGNLVGYILAATLPQPRGRMLMGILILQLIAFAAALATLGTSSSLWFDFAVMLILGGGTGYVTIVLISAIQANTPKAMLGRIMGLLMFSSSGVIPVSQAVAGAASRTDVGLMLVSAASLMILFAGAALVSGSLAAIGKTIAAPAEPVGNL